MKKSLYTLIFVFILSSFQGKRQDIKLAGKYKMEYETEYSSQNCLITIVGDKYIKTINDKSKTKGSVEILKQKFGQLFILKDKNSKLEVYVEGTTFKPSDTIFFRTKKVNEKENDDDLIIYSGKLITIK